MGRAVSMSGGTVALGDDQNHNFNELSASIEASIAAKKQEALQDQRRIGSLQSNVDALNDRCSMLEMAMGRERSERMQDTSEMQTQISREMHKLELAIETSKTQLEQRESAAQQRMSEENQRMVERMGSERKYLESAMAYVRTSVEQEKLARCASETKLWEALKQVSVPVHVFKALEDRGAKLEASVV